MGTEKPTSGKYKAILFDLYTALLDSWSLWNTVAGDSAKGLAWRKKYLQLTYAEESYRDYATLIREAAMLMGIPGGKAEILTKAWNELRPWPETNEILSALSQKMPVGIVTNSSNTLANRAIRCLGISFNCVVTAEMAGYFKPRPAPYHMALEILETPARETLFVAGSASDIPGASAVGLEVFWHNRRHLDLLPGSVQPLYEHDSLHPLHTILG